VIEFNPEFQGEALIAKGRSAVRAYFRDKTTKQKKEISIEAETFDKAPVDGKFIPIEPGLESSMSLPGYATEEASAILDAYYSQLAQLSFPASLQVEGDPEAKPDSYLEIIVLTPQGRRYFTSGLYYASVITHTISAGEYHSAYELTKSSLDIGDVSNKEAPSVATRKKARITT